MTDWPARPTTENIAIFQGCDLISAYRYLDRYRMCEGSRSYGSGFLLKFYHEVWRAVTFLDKTTGKRIVFENPGWPCSNSNFGGLQAYGVFTDLRFASEPIRFYVKKWELDHELALDRRWFDIKTTAYVEC